MGNKCQYSETLRKPSTLILESRTNIEQDDTSQIIPPIQKQPKFIQQQVSNTQSLMPTINIVPALESTVMETKKKKQFQMKSNQDLLMTQKEINGIMKSNLNQKKALSQQTIKNAHFTIQDEQKTGPKSEHSIKLSNLLVQKQKFCPLVSVFSSSE